MPRPSKCKPELIEQVATLVSEGVTPRAAAMSLGVSSANHANWTNWGRRDSAADVVDSPYREYFEAIARAEGLSEVELTKLARGLIVHKPKSAEAALAHLGRRHSEGWGESITVKHKAQFSKEFFAFLEEGAASGRLCQDAYKAVLAYCVRYGGGEHPDVENKLTAGGQGIRQLGPGYTD